MKNGHLMLRASITAALATASACSFASTASAPALAGIDTTEAPRVTQVVNSNVVSILRNTHLGLLSTATPGADVDASMPMKHLQLVLRPSVVRAAQLQALISQQHDPSSARFHQWLTPQQYGQAFGVADSDIAAATAWLTAQGFKVNGVYPNRTQIDFSGTAGQVNLAFHTREAHYRIDGENHIANATDISVPTALRPVVSGVLGLNDLHPQAQHVAAKVGTWNAAKHRFALKQTAATPTASKPDPMAVTFDGGTRGLVPDDMVAMYGIAKIRANGVVGKGITIAVVEDGDMVPADWTNFVSQFNLGSYGGTFKQFQPQIGTMNNCLDEDTLYGYQDDYTETLLDAEWSTAIAPGANIQVATCSDYDASGNPVNGNFFGGVYMAANNLINGDVRPDIISASYGFGETKVDSASKAAIDAMWAQADAEGISVFVSSGDSGTNPSFNGRLINGDGIDANAFATSSNVTAVGGTDTADVLDGTTSKYFSTTPGASYGTALGYVPEIPWNESCGNGVAAKVMYGGFSSAPAFCQFLLNFDQDGYYLSSEAGSGGPSSVDRKPAWQRTIYNAPKDQSRDVPDVALFAGSYGNATFAVICTSYYPCAPNFSTPTQLEGGTSLSAPMFAGIQALIDQGIAMRGLPADQGNAAPTLYALAQQEYGGASGAVPATLAACNADNGNTGTSACVFHNVTRGSISTECLQEAPSLLTGHCYFFGTAAQGLAQIGLTSLSATQYTPQTKAYSAQPGWSFAAGLGSVNSTNLLIAWRAFVNAPPASPQ
jgi:subtilase family serine protease